MPFLFFFLQLIRYWFNRCNMSDEFGLGKEAIDEYDGKISKARENVQRLEDGRKHHHGVISNPERIAACKSFAEITQHNQNVQKLEWERQR